VLRCTLIVNDLLRFVYDDIFSIGLLVNLSRSAFVAVSRAASLTSSSCNTVYACKHDNVNSYNVASPGLITLNYPRLRCLRCLHCLRLLVGPPWKERFTPHFTSCIAQFRILPTDRHRLHSKTFKQASSSTCSATTGPEMV